MWSLLLYNKDQVIDQNELVSCAAGLMREEHLWLAVIGGHVADPHGAGGVEPVQVTHGCLWVVAEDQRSSHSGVNTLQKFTLCNMMKLLMRQNYNKVSI